VQNVECNIHNLATKGIEDFHFLRSECVFSSFLSQKKPSSTDGEKGYKSLKEGGYFLQRKVVMILGHPE
jgi:hypothetical protein